MDEQPLQDPYQLRSEDVVDPPRKLLSMLQHLGPGLILAAGLVGSGELIATTVLGAENGYALMWLILVSCVIKVFVLHEIGRYTIGTGETSLQAFDRIPGPRFRVSWVVWLYGLLVMFSLFAQGGMLGAISEILHKAIPAIPFQGWLWVTVIVTFVMLSSGRYGVVERVAMVSVVTFTILTLSTAFVLLQRPGFFSWPRLLEGFSFDMPKGGFGTAVTVFGITGVGAMDLITYPYFCIEKGYARFTGPRDGTKFWQRRAQGWIRVMGVDVSSSMILYTLPTIAFYLLGAGVLTAVGVVPKGTETIEALSKMYTQVLGEWALYLFLLGAFAVLYSTVFVGAAALSRGFADFLASVGVFDGRNYRARLRVIRILVAFFLVVPAAFFMYLKEPVVMIKVGGIAAAAMLPILAGSTIYLRYRHLPKVVAPKGWITLGLWVTSVVIVVMVGYALIGQLSSQG